ncbi:50S ribosomal protein L15 [archaeon]|nr:50S ribosomal protein L15 [archaeon]
MTTRRVKKVRKFRGHRTYGTGSHKKAKGAGNRGGRGEAGYHKHKWSYVLKYEPDHFGKEGFKRPTAVLKNIKAINLKDLDKKVEQLLKENVAEKEGDKIKINVLKLGYQKVLGAGELTQPLIIESKMFSRSAIKKLEEAGGKAIKI